MWGDVMAKIYARKILESDGGFTIDDVPEKWREQVLALLEEES